MTVTSTSGGGNVANEDSANQWLDKAVQFQAKGDTEQAYKCAVKANNLYSSQRARDLVDATKPNYSEQQLVAVQKVQQCTDYYEILGVSKGAPDSDVKRAYKKLALLLHPDKNRAPGADAAFKKVGSAAAILLDAEKRKQYDMFGNTSGQERSTSRHQSQHHAYAARHFETEFSAEEFFNMFFHNAGPTAYTARTTRTHHQAHRGDREAQGNYATVLQMLPILGLILLSTVSTLFISDPIYSLSQSSKFAVQRKTENLKIPYYVKDNFHNEYQGSLRRLEMSVEEDYIVNLKMACQRERAYRENLMWKSRHIDSRQYQSVSNMKMPSCDALSDLQR